MKEIVRKGEGGGVGIKDYKMIGGGRDTERIIRIIKEGEGGVHEKDSRTDILFDLL